MSTPASLSLASSPSPAAGAHNISPSTSPLSLEFRNARAEFLSASAATSSIRAANPHLRLSPPANAATAIDAAEATLRTAAAAGTLDQRQHRSRIQSQGQAPTRMQAQAQAQAQTQTQTQTQIHQNRQQYRQRSPGSSSISYSHSHRQSQSYSSRNTYAHAHASRPSTASGHYPSYQSSSLPVAVEVTPPNPAHPISPPRRRDVHVLPGEGGADRSGEHARPLVPAAAISSSPYSPPPHPTQEPPPPPPPPKGPDSRSAVTSTTSSTATTSVSAAGTPSGTSFNVRTSSRTSASVSIIKTSTGMGTRTRRAATGPSTVTVTGMTAGAPSPFAASTSTTNFGGGSNAGAGAGAGSGSGSRAGSRSRSPGTRPKTPSAPAASSVSTVPKTPGVTAPSLPTFASSSTTTTTTTTTQGRPYTASNDNRNRTPVPGRPRGLRRRPSAPLVSASASASASASTPAPAPAIATATATTTTSTPPSTTGSSAASISTQKSTPKSTLSLTPSHAVSSFSSSSHPSKQPYVRSPPQQQHQNQNQNQQQPLSKTKPAGPHLAYEHDSDYYRPFSPFSPTPISSAFALASSSASVQVVPTSGPSLLAPVAGPFASGAASGLPSPAATSSTSTGDSNRTLLDVSYSTEATSPPSSFSPLTVPPPVRTSSLLPPPYLSPSSSSSATPSGPPASNLASALASARPRTATVTSISASTTSTTENPNPPAHAAPHAHAHAHAQASFSSAFAFDPRRRQRSQSLTTPRPSLSSGSPGPPPLKALPPRPPLPPSPSRASTSNPSPAPAPPTVPESTSASTKAPLHAKSDSNSSSFHRRLSVLAQSPVSSVLESVQRWTASTSTSPKAKTKPTSALSPEPSKPPSVSSTSASVASVRTSNKLHRRRVSIDPASLQRHRTSLLSFGSSFSGNNASGPNPTSARRARSSSTTSAPSQPPPKLPPLPSALKSSSSVSKPKQSAVQSATSRLWRASTALPLAPFSPPENPTNLSATTPSRHDQSSDTQSVSSASSVGPLTLTLPALGPLDLSAPVSDSISLAQQQQLELNPRQKPSASGELLPEQLRDTMYRDGHGYEYYNPSHHQNLRINTHTIPLDDQTSMTPTPDTAILMPSSYDRFTGSAAADPYNRMVTSRSRATDSPQQASRSRKPSQKEMLSRALQKANTAVELDNVQNFEGARRAYIEASELLDQVIMRVGVDDVRRRLEEIRDRYTSRIEELDNMGQLELEGEKELPARPERDSADFMLPQNMQPPYHEEEDNDTETPRLQNSAYYGEPMQPYQQSHMLAIPERQHRSGHLHSAFSTSPSGAGEWVSSDRNFLQHPDDEQYMPRPLSPYRGPGSRNPSPNYGNGMMPHQQSDLRSEFASQSTGRELGRRPSNNSLHARARSQDSWLDHAGGSGESTVSSLHSRSSSMQHPSRQSVHMRSASRSTEIEFDAALDAAVEAAYDDPYEPLTPVIQRQRAPTLEGEDPVTQAMRKVEQAKERVRQTQLEASRLEQERQMQRDLQQKQQQQQQQQLEEEERRYQEMQEQQNRAPSQNAAGDFFDDANSSDDDEPTMAGVDVDYKVEDFDANQGDGIDEHADDSMHPQIGIIKSRSDNLATRTWFSTGTSAPPSATFPAEDNPMGIDFDAQSLAPSEYDGQTLAPEDVQSQSQPHAPLVQTSPAPSDGDLVNVLKTRDHSRTASVASLSVRNRRLSGQNPKQLMIETQPVRRSSVNEQIIEVVSPDPNDITITQDQVLHHDYDDEVAPEVVDDVMEMITKQPPASAPPVPINMGLNMYSTPPMTLNEFEDIPEDGRSVSPMSSRILRKNYSSNSLRSMRTRNMSVSNIDDISDMSPGTPASTYGGRSSNYPSVPTPLSAAFADHMKNESTEAVYFADVGLNHINSHGSAGIPISPRPGHAVIDPSIPVALEPCPNDFLLRPFWMMRCLYQTLCHPRGGFISNKLFIPRDVWQVKGVKLKNIDDKVQACDTLTTALEKLGRVDTNDADNMLEEMQSLENVLDQLTQQLTRKLGGDVGIQTPSVLFRESSTGAESESGSAVPRSTSVSNKAGSSFSWRRLRSKTSQAGLTSQYSGSSSASGNASITMRLDSSHGVATSKRDSPPTEMLPMTTTPITRPPRRDIKKVSFDGPNSTYMEALARLFDAAQTVDQIARQVEDPGLKHADKTQVGLELCTRHAAEFFAFYIIRFAMADLTNLLDKFVKRGTEWAIA